MASSIVIEPHAWRVEIDWAPAYEMVASMEAFASRSEHKTLELGSPWLKRVRQQVSPELAQELSAPNELNYMDAIRLLIRKCPANRDADRFVAWLRSLSLGELYELLETDLLYGREELLSGLGAIREGFVCRLSAWNEQYFRHLDPAILEGLEADADSKRALARLTTPDDLIEIATNGVSLLKSDGVEVVLLVPQYHYRPWNLYADFRGTRFYQYPADALPTPPGEPPPDLVRAARALSDPSRLRILRHLGEGPRSFTELVQLTGLSKSTVHHHTVILRAARLIRVIDAGAGPDTYTLRTDLVDELSSRFSTYLTPARKNLRGEKDA